MGRPVCMLLCFVAACDTRRSIDALSHTYLDVRSRSGRTVVELKWGGGAVECVDLPDVTVARIDGAPMTTVSLGRPKWKRGYVTGLPFRDCPRGAYFEAPTPDGGVTANVVEVSDGKKTLRLEARHAFTTVRWNPVPGGEVSVGQRLEVTSAPTDNAAMPEPSVHFTPDGGTTLTLPRGLIKPVPGGLAFDVPPAWDGEGQLIVGTRMLARVTRCELDECRVLPPQHEDVLESWIRVGR